VTAAGGGGRPILGPGDYLSLLEDEGLVNREGWPTELVLSIGSPVAPRRGRMRRSTGRFRPTPWGPLRKVGPGLGHLVTPMMGGAAMASLAELVVELGTRRIILVGSCGSLVSELESGAIVTVDSALATEGPSGAYGFGPVVPGSEELAVDVSHRLGGRGSEPDSIERLRGWTVASPFLTTPTLRDAAVSAGARVVEMEAASLFAVAIRRRVDAVVVGVVADGLGGTEWSAPDLSRTGIRLAEVVSALVGEGA